MKKIVYLLAIVFTLTITQTKVFAAFPGKDKVENAQNKKNDKHSKSSVQNSVVQTELSQNNGPVSTNLPADDNNTVLMIVLAFILPPLAVYMYEGNNWTKRVTTNLILTLLCGLPGLIHALIVILGKK
jgi:uncharacterized membrane protein YqaE (UPF0057 family)